VIDVTFSELRNNAKSYFDRVEAGETLEVYRHGKPIAVIRPIAKRETNRWKRSDPLELDGVSLSRSLLAERRRGRV
jgi:prevent-host-death family protein